MNTLVNKLRVDIRNIAGKLEQFCARLSNEIERFELGDESYDFAKASNLLMLIMFAAQMGSSEVRKNDGTLGSVIGQLQDVETYLWKRVSMMTSVSNSLIYPNQPIEEVIRVAEVLIRSWKDKSDNMIQALDELEEEM